MRADLESRLEGADALLRRSVEGVLSRVVPGLTHGLHGHLAWVARQVMPDTADGEQLARWAGIWNVERRDAERAHGSVVVTGTNGQTVPLTARWQRADGVVYRPLATATIASGEATVEIEAEDASEAGNAEAGTKLTAVTPILGINATAVVASEGLVDGLDVELDASLLERLLLRIRTPPRGGGPGDYVRWAREVAGVTRAWERPGMMDAGSVVVFFATDGDDGPIPSGAKVDEVQAYLESVAPVTARPFALAPTAVPLNPTIALNPDTTDARAEVQAELEDLLVRVGEPGGTLYLSQLHAAIDRAPSEISHTLEAPVADVTYAANELPTLGAIEWV